MIKTLFYNSKNRFKNNNLKNKFKNNKNIFDSIKILKVLHEWPLSRVELVEFDNHKYVLKTIHKDFKNEFFKQNFLNLHCKKTNIPQVYSMNKRNKNEISFFMEYIPSLNKEYSQLIQDNIIKLFHSETKNITNKYFKKYDFKMFYKDFLNAKKYILDSNIQDKSKKDIKKFFKIVFDSEYSIVHGDWKEEQILQYAMKYYIIDFGKSYYGPSILDYEEPKSQNKELNLKTKLIRIIISIAWYDLCKRKYIKSQYKDKFKELSLLYKELESKIKF